MSKIGEPWCCSMCREPEYKVYSAPVNKISFSQFDEELSFFKEEEDEEMEAVADTFRGVENVNGMFNWEGSDFQLAQKHQQRKCRHFKPLEVFSFL